MAVVNLMSTSVQEGRGIFMGILSKQFAIGN